MMWSLLHESVRGMVTCGAFPSAFTTLTMDDTTKNLFARAADHAVAFRQGVNARPPRPVADADTLRALFAGPTPEQGQDGARIIDDLVAAAEPGLMSNVSPRFFGWVMGASHPVGVAADWLTSAWGQNAGIYACKRGLD